MAEQTRPPVHPLTAAGPTGRFIPADTPLDDPETAVPTLLNAPQSGSQETHGLLTAARAELDASGDDTGRRGRLHHLLGLLIEHRLGDLRQALHHFLEAYHLLPENLAIIRTLRRVLTRRQSWVMVLRLLDTEIRLISSPTRTATLLLLKGKILEEQLLRSQEAQQVYVEGLRLDPGNRQILGRLRRLCWRRGDHQGVVEACRQAVAVTRERKIRGVLYAEMGRALEEHLADGESAMAAYSAALADDPANTTVRAALKRLYHRFGRWEELVEVLVTEGDLASADRDRVWAYVRAAHLCRDRLDQSERALKLLSGAISHGTQEVSILKEIATLLSQGGRYAESADVYRRLLVELRDPGEKVVTHYRLGQVLEQRLGQEKEALYHYRQAVTLDPTYVPALQGLGSLFRRLGAWSDLVELEAREAEADPQPESRARRYFELAELCETHLENLKQAIAFHQRAMASQPRFPPSEHDLERLYQDTQSWGDLTELVESRLEAPGSGGADRSSPPVEGRRGATLERLGRIYEEKLGDLDRAAEHYRRALPLAADPLSLLRVLQRLYTRSGQYAELVEVLDLEVRQTDALELSLALRHRAAEVCDVRLGDVEQAESRLREVLADDPAHGPSLRSLGRICARQGRWEEVVDLYRKEVEQGRATPRRIASLLCKMGEVYLERLRDEASALVAYNRALDSHPDYLPALDALARMYKAREEWDHLLEIMERQASLVSDLRLKADLLHSMGEICESRLRQPTQAAHHLRRALELVPGHEASLTALLRLMMAERRWEEVAALFDTALDNAADDSGRSFVLRRLAELWEGPLGNAERAVEYYERALALDAEDLEALCALARVYFLTRQHEPLTGVLNRLAMLVEDGREVVAYLHLLADVLEFHLPHREVGPTYERILELDPGDPQALEALARIYGRQSDLRRLARILAAQVSSAEDPDSRETVLFSLAVVRESYGDMAGAGWALGEAAAQTENWLSGRELRRVRQRLAQWELVAASLEQEARLCRDPRLRIEALLAASRLYEDRLEDSERALVSLARILAVDPFYEDAGSRLESILERGEQWLRLLDELRRRLEAVESCTPLGDGAGSKMRIQLLFRIARIQREQLGRPEEAASTLSRCIQLDPGHLDSLLALGELYTELERWHEAADIYTRIVPRCDNPAVLRAVHLRLGQLWSEHLGDPLLAVSCYQNVLALQPAEREALRGLFQLFVKGKDWSNAADVMAQLIEVTEGHAEKVHCLVELAEIYEQGFGEPELAAEQLQRALTVEPDSGEVISLLTSLYSRLGQWDTLCDATRSYLAALPQDQQARGIPQRIELAEILFHRLGRPAEGLEQYRAVVEIDPSHIVARQAMAMLLMESGQLEEAAAEHQEVLQLDPLNTQSIRKLQIVWSRMGQTDRAWAASAVLAVLGQASEAELRVYREQRDKGGLRDLARLDPGVFERVLVHPDEPAGGRAVLSLLERTAHLICSPTPGLWGEHETCRPSGSEQECGLYDLVRAMERTLDIERELEILLSSSRPLESGLIPADPPALVVGRGLLRDLGSSRMRCLLGRLLGVVRSRTTVAHGLDASGLRALLQAAGKAVEMTLWEITEGGAGQVAEMAQHIQRALARREMQALAEACRRLKRDAPPDFSDWVLAMEHTSLRVALALCGDLETVLGCIGPPDQAPGDSGTEEDEGKHWLHHSPQALEAIGFWLDRGFLSLRRSG